MIAVETNEHEIRVKIPTDGMSPESVRAVLDWLRVEAAARLAVPIREKASKPCDPAAS